MYICMGAISARKLQQWYRRLGLRWLLDGFRRVDKSRLEETGSADGNKYNREHESRTAPLSEPGGREEPKIFPLLMSAVSLMIQFVRWAR